MNRRHFHKRFPTYVISLERTPERLARFLAWNETTDIDFDVFKAIDGAAIDIAAIDASILVPGTTTYGRGTIGVAMSHRALWQMCAGGDDPFLIFEDDAAIRRDIRTALPPLVDGLADGWDMLILGYNTNSIVEVALAADLNMRVSFAVAYPSPGELMKFVENDWPIGLLPVNTFFGNCSYVVSPKGARSLLRFCFPLDSRVVAIPGLQRAIRARTLDARINAHLRFMQAYACVPPLAMPDNAREHSARLSVG